MEIWKDIEGFEGLYQISNMGRVKSLPRQIASRYIPKERILSTIISTQGYPYANFCRDGIVKRMKLHRLVAKAFIPNPDNKPDINHIDAVRHNNEASNLEWCTKSENGLHAYRMGLNKGSRKTKNNGESNGNKKITSDTARKIYFDEGSNRVLAKKYGVGKTTIGSIKQGKAWRSALFN